MFDKRNQRGQDKGHGTTGEGAKPDAAGDLQDDEAILQGFKRDFDRVIAGPRLQKHVKFAELLRAAGEDWLRSNTNDAGNTSPSQATADSPPDLEAAVKKWLGASLDAVLERGCEGLTHDQFGELQENTKLLIGLHFLVTSQDSPYWSQLVTEEYSKADSAEKTNRDT